VFMIEQQAAYVIRLLDAMDARGARSVEVRPQAQQLYKRRDPDQAGPRHLATGGCTSWYLDATGRNRTIWPASRCRTGGERAESMRRRIRAANRRAHRAIGALGCMSDGHAPAVASPASGVGQPNQHAVACGWRTSATVRPSSGRDARYPELPGPARDRPACSSTAPQGPRCRAQTSMQVRASRARRHHRQWLWSDRRETRRCLRRDPRRVDEHEREHLFRGQRRLD
jgi:hypothetical protein